MARTRTGAARRESDDLPRVEHPARRLLAYVFRHYPWRLIVVAISIVIASVASTVASIFMQRVVDEVITRWLDRKSVV